MHDSGDSSLNWDRVRVLTESVFKPTDTINIGNALTARSNIVIVRDAIISTVFDAAAQVGDRSTIYIPHILIPVGRVVPVVV